MKNKKVRENFTDSNNIFVEKAFDTTWHNDGITICKMIDQL